MIMNWARQSGANLWVAVLDIEKVFELWGRGDLLEGGPPLTWGGTEVLDMGFVAL